MLALVIFLFYGSLNLLSLGLSESMALVVNGCLCMAFFVQHSTMIRRPFRRWLEKFIGVHYCSALYTIASSVILFALIVFWQQSDLILWEARSFPRWIHRCVFFLSFGGFYWGTRALGSFVAFGIVPILWYLRM